MDTFKRNQIKPAVFFAVILLFVGVWLTAYFLSGAYAGYSAVTRPLWILPDIAFNIIWTAMQVLNAISFFLLLFSPADYNKKSIKVTAIVLFAVEFALNIAWPFIMFPIKMYTLAFIYTALTAAIVIWLTVILMPINKAASILMMPYALWLIYVVSVCVSVAIFN